MELPRQPGFMLASRATAKFQELARQRVYFVLDSRAQENEKERKKHCT